ncbi:hypothetical protein AB0B63_07110 [Micromonospora sp. NPDC049081]|uniref:hypothetical protein n=1 Tax=Micromonospora sp. NPDC049081 TaxID=3155150 RepID=UPI0033EC5E86
MEQRFFGRDAARQAGLTETTWRSYGSTGRRPEPDGQEDGRPYWHTSTLNAFRAARTGQGERTDLHEQPEPVIRALLDWLVAGDDRTPRARFDDLTDAFKTDEQRGPSDGFARFGMTLTQWAATSSQPADTVDALATYPWLTATWRTAGQLYFTLIPRITANPELAAAIAAKNT